MKLHENIQLFNEAIQMTSKRMNIQPEYIEKDYWVTYALFQIFQNDKEKDTIFKGGTALATNALSLSSDFQKTSIW
jgi:predicted nucleotidyltransferase component of viral defense system